MFVKSIVLDGFKSYGNRTEITGFDPEFNAITGLNGTGKSNILDAICFVLGLQNLGQVRAVLLQDLVFKQGQTGVTKASVTITFDNTNKEQSPVGYESYNELTVTRQVVLGGKNKYLVNGLNAPNNRVRDLFCSVQLNVNNPHFLVMQGRITKVLNMKPMDILSMIEEASGTRMFETKKQQAEKTLEKKDSKLHEIDSIINEDIGPKLTKLKEERGQYLEYKKVERELEHLQKFYIAWKYVSYKSTSQRASEDADKMIENLNEKRQAIRAGQDEIKQIASQVAELQKQKDSESGGRLGDVENTLREAEKQLTKLTGTQKQNNENIDDEKKTIKQLEKSIKDDEKVFKTKNSTMSNIDGVFHNLAEEEEKDKTDLEKAQHKFQAISSGLVADDDGNEGTLQDKLMAAERAKTEAQTEIEQIKRQKEHCEADLKKKVSEMKKTESDFRNDNQKLESLEKEVNSLRNQVAGLNFDETRVTTLREEERQLKTEARELRNTRDNFESRDGRFTFRYTDPERNFNRNSVHGLVCKLIDVVDPMFAIAVEKTAGGRLFNVVVDTDVTSKKLLSNGKLERRTTIIPLNKISGRQLNPRVVQAAEKVGGKNNVWPAISQITYSDTLHPAMQFIFGTTLICRDLGVAKKVCYHPEVKTRCVTLDGDVCDPSGTLSGGARQQTEPVLLKLRQIKTVLRDLDAKDLRLLELERELRAVAGNQDKYMTMKQKLDLQEHELKLVRERLQQTTHYQYQEEVNTIKKKIDDLTKRHRECQGIIERETKNIKEIKDNMKNAKANRERELKQAEDDVKRLKKKAEQSRKEREKRTEEYDSLKLELEDLQKLIDTNKELIVKHTEAIRVLQEKGREIDELVAEAKDNVKTIQAELKGVKEKINLKNREITQALQRKEKIVQQGRDFELEIKQIQQDHDKLKEEAKDSKHRISEMLKQYTWISSEEQFFGKPNGVYDFNETDPHEAGKRVGKLQEQKDKLGRNINTKAMNLLALTEERYNDLMKKRKQVEQDKHKILEVIEELGEKKKATLKQACVQVNKDFTSIFSTLLPGATAKLESVDPKTVLSGLEFKVGFGGKWKESLGELSGGQRSLVALSLILAMLLFKPAPIYILDEVDAALDLSHTQNIGNMLKMHFKTSQFIIVSLKDGMFNNANVLFRTKFVDGMSAITRTVQSSKH